MNIIIEQHVDLKTSAIVEGIGAGLELRVGSFKIDGSGAGTELGTELGTDDGKDVGLRDCGLAVVRLLVLAEGFAVETKSSLSLSSLSSTSSLGRLLGLLALSPPPFF